MHSIFLYILCQAVMQALSFLYIWERVVLWEVSVWERARLVSGVGLVTVILLYIVRAHSSTLSRPICRAARDTSHRFYYSLSYSSQASSRMQEIARMLLICAVVALYTAALLVADQRTTRSGTRLCPGKNGSWSVRTVLCNLGI